MEICRDGPANIHNSFQQMLYFVQDCPIKGLKSQTKPQFPIPSKSCMHLPFHFHATRRKLSKFGCGIS